MDSGFYQQILERNLLPFLRDAYGTPTPAVSCRIMIPNMFPVLLWLGRKRTNVNHWVTPPERPDLNPIEYLWHQIKDHLRRHVKPKNKDELVAEIANFWSSISAELCTRYINHMNTVLPAVVENSGSATGY